MIFRIARAPIFLNSCTMDAAVTYVTNFAERVIDAHRVLPWNLNGYIAILSPLLYCLCVEVWKRGPRFKPETLSWPRHVHNIGLALASAAMFFAIGSCIFTHDKYRSLNDFLCKPWINNGDNDMVLYYATRMFYISKFWEWLDTFFLIQAGKKVTWLQYTHHMSTAVLVHHQHFPLLASYYALPLLLNTGVHTAMYWYYAYPRGFWLRYKKQITQTQIVQHIICVWLGWYGGSRPCAISWFSNWLAQTLYIMYFSFFAWFYLQSYIRGSRSAAPKKKSTPSTRSTRSKKVD